MQFILNPVGIFSCNNMADTAEKNHQLEVINSIDEIGKRKWNRVVESADQSSIFHRYEWLEAVEYGLGRSPLHLAIEKEGNLIAIYPNFQIPLENTPFTRLTSLEPGFGGPVASTDKTASFSKLVGSVSSVSGSRTVVNKIRAKDPAYLGYNNLLKTHGFKPTQDGCRFQIDLSSGYENVLDEMRQDRQRRITEGHEQEYEVTEKEFTDANVRQFHDAYTKVMDRVGGSAFPIDFLTHLQTMASNVLLLALRIDGEYAGGALQLLNERDSYIHGWLMAVPEEYFKHNASEIMYDSVIQWGVENGYETYDFGYTPSDASNGLYRFKKSFGGDIVPNFIWERSCSPVWPLMRTGRGLYWSHFKSPPVEK